MVSTVSKAVQLQVLLCMWSIFHLQLCKQYIFFGYATENILGNVLSKG